MTIHRIDFAQDLMGPIQEIAGAIAQFTPRDRTPDGTPCAASDVDDWSSLIGRFESGAVGVWEGSTAAWWQRGGRPGQSNSPWPP